MRLLAVASESLVSSHYLDEIPCTQLLVGIGWRDTLCIPRSTWSKAPSHSRSEKAPLFASVEASVATNLKKSNLPAGPHTHIRER